METQRDIGNRNQWWAAAWESKSTIYVVMLPCGFPEGTWTVKDRFVDGWDGFELGDPRGGRSCQRIGSVGGMIDAHWSFRWHPSPPTGELHLPETQRTNCCWIENVGKWKLLVLVHETSCPSATRVLASPAPSMYHYLYLDVYPYVAGVREKIIREITSKNNGNKMLPLGGY